VWDALDSRDDVASRTCSGSSRRGFEGAIGCEICGLVSSSRTAHPSCPRCDTALHARKPDSITRTWALVIAAAVLYLPANYYPVLTVMQLGSGQPSTILGGVEELVEARQYPLAALVFFASIAVPMLKLVGLSTLLIATQTARSGWLRDRTHLYHIIRWIGRWSMIDIFMEALLGALVRFGNVITIEPGVGAIAFCSVVILTMIAAETFDPRLMWDTAGRRIPPHAAPTLPIDPEFRAGSYGG
jgi:paraquat-inducible protein A